MLRSTNRDGALGVSGGAVDEGLYPFKVIYAVGPDVIERGILAADIVDGDFDPELAFQNLAGTRFRIGAVGD